MTRTGTSQRASQRTSQQACLAHHVAGGSVVVRNLVLWCSSLLAFLREAKQTFEQAAAPENLVLKVPLQPLFPPHQPLSQSAFGGLVFCR